MGLNDNTKNIEIALNEKNRLEQEKQREKAQREAERKKKQEEKENRKKLEKDIQQEIEKEFQRYLDITGVNYSIEFYSIERKKEILENLIKKYATIKEFKNKEGQTIKEYCSNKKEIEEIYNKNYYKILKQQENIYKLNDKYLYNKQLQEAAEEKQKKQINYTNIIKYTFYTLAFIFFFPIAFVGLVIFAVCKNSN